MGWGINVPEQGWRKGPWTPDEDSLLSEYVTLHGEGRWSSVARCAGLNRSGKSCRLRWVNYLRPGLKRGQITPQEEGIIIELHALWGNKWSTIARYLPGRTDNEIKNFWRTHFKKKHECSPLQRSVLQKRRSRFLQEKLGAEEEGTKTTAMEAKTTVTGPDVTDHSQAPLEQEVKQGCDDPTSYHHQKNPAAYQEWSTALFPWSDAAADQDCGLWGGLWDLDDNYFGYGNHSNKINNVPIIQNQARAFSSNGG